MSGSSIPQIVPGKLEIVYCPTCRHAYAFEQCSWFFVRPYCPRGHDSAYATSNAHLKEIAYYREIEASVPGLLAKSQHDIEQLAREMRWLVIVAIGVAIIGGGWILWEVLR